jgi:hypothetical protein
MIVTVINNSHMTPVATCEGLEVAQAWAETVPPQNDFSIVSHTGRDLAAYSEAELKTLHSNCWRPSHLPENISYQDLVKAVVRVLDGHPTTSALPPDEKRVASLPSNEDTDMTTTKKTAKKRATKKVVKKTAAKAPVKKKVAKKTAVKAAPRERKHGILRPKPGSIGAQVWEISDKLSKKAGQPAARKDVMAECEKAGLSVEGAAGYHQEWRRFHGLVKKVVKDADLWCNRSQAK